MWWLAGCVWVASYRNVCEVKGQPGSRVASWPGTLRLERRLLVIPIFHACSNTCMYVRRLSERFLTCWHAKLNCSFTGSLWASNVSSLLRQKHSSPYSYIGCPHVTSVVWCWLLGVSVKLLEVQLLKASHRHFMVALQCHESYVHPSYFWWEPGVSPVISSNL